MPELLQVVLGGIPLAVSTPKPVPLAPPRPARWYFFFSSSPSAKNLLAAVERLGDEVVGKAVILEYHEAVCLIRRTERLQRSALGRSRDAGEGLLAPGAETKKLGTRP